MFLFTSKCVFYRFICLYALFNLLSQSPLAWVTVTHRYFIACNYSILFTILPFLSLLRYLICCHLKPPILFQPFYQF